MFEPANSYSTLKRIQTGVDYYAQHRWHFIQLRSCILSRVIYKPQPGYEDSNLLSHFPSPTNLKQKHTKPKYAKCKGPYLVEIFPFTPELYIYTHTHKQYLPSSFSQLSLNASWQEVIFFFQSRYCLHQHTFKLKAVWLQKWYLNILALIPPL